MRYLGPNLNKLLADRRASVQDPRIEECVRGAVQKVFPSAQGIIPKYFITETTGILNRPELAIAVLAPEQTMQEPTTLPWVEKLIREYGGTDRTFKSAVIVAIADSNAQMCEEARKLLAWEDIRDDESEKLSDAQIRQLDPNIKKAERDLKESVWRAYKHVALLGKDNTVQLISLEGVTSSSSASMTNYILQDLRKADQILDYISPRFLVRNWPPAFREWSTQSVRNACFASPQFPRLLDSNAIKSTIANGVSSGEIAYVGKVGDRYEPFKFQESLSVDAIEISDDVFIITGTEAADYKQRITEPSRLASLKVTPQQIVLDPEYKQTYTIQGFDQRGQEFPLDSVEWSATGGSITPEGVLTTDKAPGNFTVTAKSGDVTTTVNYTLRAKTVNNGEGTYPGTGTGTGTISPPPPPPNSLKWKGEIPTNKWTNFYMRVLSKFAADKNLNLKLTVEVEAEGEISEQKRQEAEAALRELVVCQQIVEGYNRKRRSALLYIHYGQEIHR